MKRRWITLLLIFAVVLSVMPGVARAEDNTGAVQTDTYRVNCVYPDGSPDLVYTEFRKMDTLQTAESDYITDTDQIVSQIHAAMNAWLPSVTVHYFSPDEPTMEIATAFFDKAIAETGVATQGDYLRYSMHYYGISNSYYTYGKGFYCDITYEFGFFTTAEQEAVLTAEINRVLNGFGFTGTTSDYQKIKTIYDYLCANITYDYENLNDPDYTLKYSAYAALIQKTAVCQGYATLYYRMLMEEGIPARIISGTSNGQNHAWNIVKLNGKFYNMDATWDAGYPYYQYFLKCPANFPDHTRDAEYETEAFHAQYPMWSTDYDANQADSCTLNGHTEQVLPAVAASCTEAGKSEGTKCSVCDVTLIAQNPIPAKGHQETVVPGKAATCTESGLTEGKKCAVCSAELVSQEKIPAKGHSFRNGKCDICGAADPDYVAPTEPKPTEPKPTEPKPIEPEAPSVSDVSRVYGDNRYQTGFAVADQLKKVQGIDKFQTIVVASGKEFPDALAGAYLANRKNAPILLVNQNTIADVAAYITGNLSSNGTVYLLGGQAAIPNEMEAALTGYKVNRLAGANRYETNLKILAEAGTAGQEILICTGRGFADSLSASAVNKPILLVNKQLNDAQKAFLKSSSGKFIIIGGESAVSGELEAEIRSYGSVERVSGENRYETSVLVAKRFFAAPKLVVLAYAKNFPDGLCGGPLAFRLGAPLILTASRVEADAAQYTKSNHISAGLVLGGESLIPAETVNAVFGQ